MAPILSITAANYNSPEWAELFVKSAQKFTTLPHEIIVIDNGSLANHLTWLRKEAEAQHIVLHENSINFGHGKAIDQGTHLARGRFVCAMNIDAFFMRPGWDMDIIEAYDSDPSVRMVARRGTGTSIKDKPIAPPIYFYEREFALKLGLTFIYAPGQLKGSTDSTMAAYWQIVDAGYKVKLLGGVGRMATNPGGGDIVEIAGKPTIYHHYYGARFRENDPSSTYQIIDGRTLESHLARKAELFGLPIVKDILTWT